MKSWLALIFLIMPVVVVAQATFNLRTGTNAISFRAGFGDKIVLSVGHIFYKDNDADESMPTEDSYIVEVINGNYPVIADRIEGHDLSFRLANIDETNGQELLVFYHAGANQYGVKIYKIDRVGLTLNRLNSQPVSSDLGYVKIHGKQIIVENWEHDDNPASSLIHLYTDVYHVVGDECQLIKEDNQIVPNNANSGTN